MWKFRLVGLLVALFTATGAEEVEDFVAVNSLPDGEVETRIHFQGLYAKDTSVGRGSLGLQFRQVAKPHHLLQLIYQDDVLKDCEIIHNRDQVVQFLSDFKSDLSRLLSTANISIASLDHNQSLPASSAWLDYPALKHQCRKLHEEVRQRVIEQRHEKESGRGKRSVFIVPGTVWCGSDDQADRYQQLGTWSKTDMCCRRHDHCKMGIPGFSTKFHYYNFTPFTISHCHCDSSFRACLKMVDTGDANLVGKLFFNVVQTKCFVVKPRKVCVKTSWWGQCLKYKHEKHAILRDNIPY